MHRVPAVCFSFAALALLLASSSAHALTTTTTVTSSVNPSVFGQSVTFTATVVGSSGTPTGTVNFNIGGTPLSGTLNASGVATVSYAGLAASGTAYTITATYPTTGVYTTSTGTLPVGQTVNKAATTATLTSSLNPSTTSDSVTFTATIAAVAPGAGTPAGASNVIFTIDGAAQTPVSPTSGIATFTTSSLTKGSHTVFVTYNGDTNFTATNSSSTLLTQVVGTTFTFTTTTIWSLISPPPTSADTVIFSASGGVESLSINVNNAVCNSLQISAAVNATARLFIFDSNSNLTVNSIQTSGSGSFSLDATKGTFELTGNGTLPGSPDFSAFNNLIINAPGKTVSLGTGIIVAGTLTVKAGTLDLNGKTLSGANLFDGGVNTGSINLSSTGMTLNGSAATTYSGAMTSAGAGQLIYSGGTGGSLTLGGTCSQSSGSVLNSGTLLINGTHTRVVTVNGGTLGGTGQITYGPGYADMKAGTLQPGTPSATGIFKTEGIFTANSALAVRLNSATPGTGYDQVVVDGGGNLIDLAGCTLNATLGTGTKLNDTFTIVSATNGAVILNQFKGLPDNFEFDIGAPAFRINYTKNLANQITAVTLTQTQSVTTTTLTSSANPSTVDQNVTFTAAVTTNGFIPTGTVTFTIGSTPSTVTLGSDGKASISVPFNAASAGTAVSVAYNGEATQTYLPSASNTVTQVVNAIATTTTLTFSSNPALVGQNVTVTATVTSATGAIPTGSVVFTGPGGSTQPISLDANGVATLIIPAVTNAGIPVGATFTPSSPSFASSTATPATLVVNLFSKNIFAVASQVPGSPSQVRVYDAQTQALLFAFLPFPLFRGSVTVAVGDVDGDGVPDIIVGSGPGGGPQVSVFSGKNGAQLKTFFAFDRAFKGGVTVASADVNGDGFDDIIVGSGPGGGPQVSVFSGKDGAPLSSFFAFASTFTGGVRVAAADLNGDGKAEIIIGAGPGAGPQVSVFDIATGTQTATFFAFSPAITTGVTVATGDVNGDGVPDIIVSTGGLGVTNIVNVFDGTKLSTPTPFKSLSPLPNYQGEVSVAFDNVTGIPRLIVGASAAGSPASLGFSDFTNLLSIFQPFGANYNSGFQIAAGSASTLAVLSGPTASPSSPMVNEVVTFTAAASGGAQTYTWTFGDGTTGSGNPVTHKFAPVSTYTVTVSIAGRGQTLTSSLLLTVKPATNGAGVLPGESDSNGNGLSDTMTHELGPDDTAAVTTAGLIPGGTPTTTSYKVTSVTAPPGTPRSPTPDRKSLPAKVNKLTLTGTIMIPAGFVVNGTTVVADVGGFAKKFKLGKTGKSAKLPDKSSFAITVKSKKGVVAAQTTKFTLVLIGIPDSAKTPVPYQLLLGNIIYQKQ